MAALTRKELYCLKPLFYQQRKQMPTALNELQWVITARHALESITGVTYGKQNAVLKLIALKYRVKESTLRRTIFILRAIKKVEVSDHKLASMLYCIPFSKSELIEKISRIDFAIANLNAVKALSNEVSVRQLRDVIYKVNKTKSIGGNKKLLLPDDLYEDLSNQPRWFSLNEIPKVQSVPKNHWIIASGVKFIAIPVDPKDRILAVIIVNIGSSVSERHLRKTLVSHLLKSIGLTKLGYYVKIYIRYFGKERQFQRDITLEISSISDLELVFVLPNTLT